MAGGRSAELVSDGCTGFQWAHEIWPGVYECCVEHDFGGSDGTLLDCWTGAGMPIAFAGFALLVMILLRPAYHWLRERGWWPGG